MKYLYLLGLFLLSPIIHGQEVPAYGFVELVNAVVSKERLNVEIDGKELVKGGIRPNACTGGFILPAGPHDANLTIDGIPSRGGKIEVEAGKTKVYAIYLRPNKAKDKDEVPYVLSLKPLSGPESGKGFHLKLFNLCPEDHEISLNRKKVALTANRSMDYPGWRGGQMEVKKGRKIIGRSLVEEAGTYHLIVATDHQGNYSSSFVRILDYELPPWFEAAEE